MIVRENLGDGVPENQQAEPSLISNEIQVWTQMFEQKSNDRITKMREKMDNKMKTIPTETGSNRVASTTINPRTETLETQKSEQIKVGGKMYWFSETVIRGHNVFALFSFLRYHASIQCLLLHEEQILWRP